MRKFFLCFFIVFCMCTVFGGCSKTDYSGVSIENIDEVTDGVRSALINRTYRINVTFNSHAKKMDDEGVALLAKNIYEAAVSDTGDPRGGAYLRYQTGGYKVRYKCKKKLNSYEHIIRLLPDYYTTAKEEEEVDRKVDKIIRQIKSQLGYDPSAKLDINDRDTVKKATKLVHDEICDIVTYDDVHGSGNYSHIGASAYCALHYHTATCQGYSVLMYRMLTELGIHNQIVTGDYIDPNGRREYHAWNMVDVCSTQLAVDTTLDDENDTLDYFLVDPGKLSEDHVMM